MVRISNLHILQLKISSDFKRLSIYTCNIIILSIGGRNMPGLSLSMPEDTLYKLKQYCNTNHLVKSNVVTEAVDVFLATKEPKMVE